MKENLYLMKINNEYGYIDNQGNWRIQPQFTNARDFEDELSLVKLKSGERAFINEEGNVVFKVFDNLFNQSTFKNGLADFTTMERKTGFINKNGEVVIKPKFSSSTFGFNDSGTCIVTVGDQFNYKYGLINREGEFVVEPIYDGLAGLSDGLMYTEKNDKRGFIDAQGNVVVDFEFEKANTFSEGLCNVTKGNKNGYIDTKGNFVLELDNDLETHEFKNGRAVFYKNKKYGYIDIKGNVVIKNKYFLAMSFSEGFASFSTTKGSGYIDVNDKKLFKKAIFLTTNDFHNGLGRINYNSEWGYVNTKGEFVYKPVSLMP